MENHRFWSEIGLLGYRFQGLDRTPSPPPKRIGEYPLPREAYKTFELINTGTLPPGGYSQKSWVGVCGPLPKTLTLFVTKLWDIPYPIYDLTKNSKPYLWPDHDPDHQNPVSDLRFSYFPLNYRKHNFWWALVYFLFDNDEKMTSLKKYPYQGKNHQTLFMIKWSKSANIDTLFMTKMAEKPYPLGPTFLLISHIRDYPPRALP